MRKRIAKIFLTIAKWINPGIVVQHYQMVENYRAMDIGKCLRVPKKDLKKIKGDSYRERKANAVKIVKEEIGDIICNSIKKDGLIEYIVEGKDGDIYVDGRLHINVKDEDNDVC